jgi:hypothetical protein
MENTRIWGLIIVVLLVLSLAIALFSMAGGTATQSQKKENMITSNYTLTDAQVSGVNRVNIHYAGNASSFGLRFNNQSENLYNISVQRGKGVSAPNITYTKNGDVLDVNVTMDQGSADIILGNRATYNGNFETKVGGYNIYLGNNSKVENITANIKYVGGGILVLGDTTFQKIDMNVNTGGFIITSLPNKTINSGNITANTQIGGVNLQLAPSDQLGVKINGTVDLGGFNFNPQAFNIITNSSNQINIESTNFNNKQSKLQIETNIGMGGININQFNFFPINTE